MARYSDEQMSAYIEDVMGDEKLDEEIGRLKRILAGLSGRKEPDTARNISLATQAFQALLTEKARQDAIYQMRYYNRSNPQNASASPANNTGTRVSVGDVLKEEVARSGH